MIAEIVRAPCQTIFITLPSQQPLCAPSEPHVNETESSVYSSLVRTKTTVCSAASTRVYVCRSNSWLRRSKTLFKCMLEIIDEQGQGSKEITSKWWPELFCFRCEMQVSRYRSVVYLQLFLLFIDVFINSFALLFQDKNVILLVIFVWVFLYLYSCRWWVLIVERGPRPRVGLKLISRASWTT